VKLLLIVFLSSILMVASISIFVSAAQAGSDGVSRVISVLGIAKVQGEDVIVDILVEVQHGQDPNEVARPALAAQGARPFESASLGSAGFTLTGLVWDTLPVVQNYNPGSSKTDDEPDSLGGNGQTALTNTHTTWDGVTTSLFNINFFEITDRCPSLVRECKGRQFFDGNNDVAWLELPGGTLGVAWFGTSIDEVDIALNTNFDWANDGSSDIDAETVFLHENGHTVGLGHSDITGAVMEPVYAGVRQALDDDDKEGVTFLYDSDITGSVSGTVTDGTNPIGGATVVLEGTGLSATTAADGSYTISGVPDPVTYTVTASAEGFESATILRLTVSSVAIADFALTATGGESTNDVPTVSITSPADGSTFDSGATILFEGTASDTEDGDLTASLVWTSDIDGQIGTGGSFSTTLTDDTHTITASVTDSGGKTGSASIGITVGSPPADATTVSVSSIDYATEGGKNADKHLLITVALVDDLENPVSGASVSINLFRDGSHVGSGTGGITGTDGKVTWSLKNAKSGCYTTTVTDVTGEGLTWDSATPANEFCK